MQSDFDKVQIITISQDNHLQRVDNFLFNKLKGVPKGKVYKILRKGEVRVNKKRVKPDFKLSDGDLLRIPPVKIDATNEPTIGAKALSQIENAIIYEDDRVMVINKPSGLAVHGGSGLNFGLIEGLRKLRPNAHFLELVHRLDRDTSGCMLVAKKRSALRHLHEQLRTKKMNKVYHALVDGMWPVDLNRVQNKLFKNQIQSGERMVFVDERGKDSETRFKLLAEYTDCSLVEAKPITGRTHQIRVHCQSQNHPIANDDKYGCEEFSQRIKNAGCKRLCLHAYELSFLHPKDDKLVSFHAPYDNAMKQLLDVLNA